MLNQNVALGLTEGLKKEWAGPQKSVAINASESFL